MSWLLDEVPLHSKIQTNKQMAKPQGHTQILYINMKLSDDVTEKLTLTYMGQYLLMAWNDGTCAISDNKCSCLKFKKCSDYK